jgi:uncharacterized protein (TIGR02217 family)
LSVSFDDVLYPTAVTAGAAGPEFSTVVTEYGSGFEGRNQDWSSSRLTFDLGSRPVDVAEAELIVAFFRARKGKARGFRIRDPFDSRSCSALANPAAADQGIGTGDGATLTFQLVKTYTHGGQSEARRITRPVAASVLIALNGVPTGAGWTVDVTTGIVTFAAPPAAGVVISAGYRFDVPARFNIDTLMVESVGGGNIMLPPIPAIELRE